MTTTIPRESIEPHEGHTKAFYELHETWIIIEGIEIDLKLRVLFTPPHRGRYIDGRKIEPDESSEYEIEEAWWLVNGEWEHVPDKIFEIIKDMETEFLERIGVI